MSPSRARSVPVVAGVGMGVEAGTVADAETLTAPKILSRSSRPVGPRRSGSYDLLLSRQRDGPSASPEARRLIALGFSNRLRWRNFCKVCSRSAIQGMILGGSLGASRA
jgi:hypothetical protein